MKKCKNCSERRFCQDDYVSWIFFAIGLIATIAIRAVTLLMRVEPLYGKIAWYIGVVGFLLFFVYKFRIYNHRSKAIREKSLVQRTQEGKLTESEKNEIAMMLCSLSSRKESINYFFIFILSAIALAIAMYLDFMQI
ncbi:hypothetical protein ACFL96_17000 [Thermoproteota archaeon]